MFPAGEVSTYKDGKLMVDKPWEEGAIKVIRKALKSLLFLSISCKKTVGYFIYFLK
jgi:helix-turn-helix protein